jgi:hypothetical protein
VQHGANAGNTTSHWSNVIEDSNSKKGAVMRFSFGRHKKGPVTHTLDVEWSEFIETMRDASQVPRLSCIVQPPLPISTYTGDLPAAPANVDISSPAT